MDPARSVGAYPACLGLFTDPDHRLVTTGFADASGRFSFNAVSGGRYRLVAGVWNPATGGRLRRRWGGLVPTFDTAVELGTLEVLARP